MSGPTLLQDTSEHTQAQTPIGLDQLTVTGKLRNLTMPSATCHLFGILIAADDPGVVEEAARELAQHWFPIHKAIGGRQAIIVAKARQPMAAVIDFSMRDQHGTEACLQIKQSCPGMRIVVTADTESEQQARDAGFGVLPKPLDISSLLTLLERLTING